MSHFPLFIDLKGKKCIVVGGGKVATRRIKVLAGFGADITVISPEVDREIYHTGAEIIPRNYRHGDIDSAFMVVAATSDVRVNNGIYREAIEKNILVNSVNAVDSFDSVNSADFANVVHNADSANHQKKYGFLFPSIIKTDDIVVGISTSGAYPKLSKSLRKEIEGLISKDYHLEQLKKQRKEFLSQKKGE